MLHTPATNHKSWGEKRSRFLVTTGQTVCKKLRTVMSSDTIYPMNIHELLAKITGDSGRSIAKKAGLNERTVLHQISKDRMPVENIVTIAATYGYSPVRALIDYGVMDESWANIPDIEGALREASDEQLADEFLRRMKLAPNPEWNEPVGDLEARRRARRTSPPESTSAAGGEQRSGSDATPPVRGPEDDVMPEDAVANDRPEEGGTPDDFEP